MRSDVQRMVTSSPASLVSPSSFKSANTSMKLLLLVGDGSRATAANPALRGSQPAERRVWTIIDRQLRAVDWTSALICSALFTCEFWIRRPATPPRTMDSNARLTSSSTRVKPPSLPARLIEPSTSSV